MTVCRNNLHEIRGPADVRPGGRCLLCSRATQRRYRHRCRHALALVRAQQNAS